MDHQAKVVKVEKVANGILAVRARCCADKSTDSVLSLHELSRLDEEILQDVKAHLARVEAEHADALRADALVKGLLKVG